MLADQRQDSSLVNSKIVWYVYQEAIMTNLDRTELGDLPQ